MGAADRLGLRAHAARHDDAAVLFQRRADGVERLLLGAVEEAAGVDDDGVGPGVGFRQFVAFGAQPREDALGIDERLGATQGNEGDTGRCGHGPPLATSGADPARAPNRLAQAARRGKRGRRGAVAAAKKGTPCVTSATA